MGEYRQLLGEMLVTFPGIKESKSYVVMEEIKDSSEFLFTIAEKAIKNNI